MQIAFESLAPTVRPMVAPCTHPIHLVATERHTCTGEVRHRSFDQRCGTRVASRCPGCSELYVGDARRLVSSGLADDAQPYSWVTLTAPGAAAFGKIHSGPDKRGYKRRCACGVYHRSDTKALGTPIDPSTYDYEKAARFNAHVSRLFSVVVQKLRRLTGQDLQCVRVVEYQRRGLAHIHALVRGNIESDTLRLAIRGGVNPTTGRQISATRSGGFSFGPQCDVRPVTEDGKVGSYLLKLLAYTVKAAADDLPRSSDHASSMNAAGASSVRCDLYRHECHDGNRHWAHPGERARLSCRRHNAARRGWGFRGHVLAATRRWGMTLTAIRGERHVYAAEQAPPTAWDVIEYSIVSDWRPRIRLAGAVP